MLKYSVVVRVPAWLNSCLDITYRPSHAYDHKPTAAFFEPWSYSHRRNPSRPYVLVATGPRKPILNRTVRVIDHVVPEGAGLIKMQIGAPPNTIWFLNKTLRLNIYTTSMSCRPYPL